MSMLAEDSGDHVVLRPVAAALGAFAVEIGVLGSDEAKRLDREEELVSEGLATAVLPDSKGRRASVR